MASSEVVNVSYARLVASYSSPLSDPSRVASFLSLATGFNFGPNLLVRRSAFEKRNAAQRAHAIAVVIASIVLATGNGRLLSWSSLPASRTRANEIINVVVKPVLH